nr:piggyBac transposable element-derived protein 4-like [Nomia melanderi]
MERRSRRSNTGANEICDGNEWFDPKGNQPNIMPFTRTSAAKTTDEKVRICTKAEEFYALFVTDEILQHISEQTNLYATQCRITSKCTGKWTPTNKNELKRLFGLIIWMGMVKLPSLRLYWSQDPLFSQTFLRTVISRDRFEILMRMLHFADNEAAVATNRLSKIQFIIDELNTNFQKYYDPPEVLCVDESLIPFRGRIVFRQYLKQKKHKYGIKIFKLYCGHGYTHNCHVYTGKAIDKENITTLNVVMSLLKNLFHRGHTLCADNWYNSIDLANRLIDKNAHLIGTLRAHRKKNSSEVIKTNLKRGEVIAKENNQGITVLKWKDKRDVLVLSTKHSSVMINVNTKRGVCCKLKIIVEYNKAKTSIDLSDQMSAYSSPLRKTLKWYKKLAFELCFNTAVVNSLFLFQEVTGQKISVTEFRRQLVNGLTQRVDEQIPLRDGKIVHKLQKKERDVHKVQKYCSGCYDENSRLFGSKKAKNLTRKVVTFCYMCKSQPHFCLECFNKAH